MHKLSRNEYIAVFVGLVVVGSLFLFGIPFLKLPEILSPSNTNTSPTSMEQANDLIIQDTVMGTGAEAVAGKKISVHYTGTLEDGTKFDSSLDRGTPFEFTLGAGEVIVGWDRGLVGMKVGGTRVLIIPSELAYGDRQIGPIPPNSTLLFTVQLLGVE